MDANQKKPSAPPPLTSKARPPQLSTLPKSAAVIETPAASPEFPGAFPKERLAPKSPFIKATVDSAQLGRPSSLPQEHSQISNSTSFYTAAGHDSFIMSQRATTGDEQNPSVIATIRPSKLGPPGPLPREDSQISNSTSFYTTRGTGSFTVSKGASRRGEKIPSSTNWAENDSKRGRDGHDFEALDGTASKKQKLMDDDGEDRVGQALPAAPNKPEDLQAQLTEKGLEVLELRTELKKANTYRSIAEQDLSLWKKKAQMMRNKIDGLEMKLDANQEFYKKVIAQMLRHIDQQAASIAIQIKSGTTNLGVGQDIARSLRVYEMDFAKKSDAQVVAEVSRRGVDELPQIKGHGSSGSTLVNIAVVQTRPVLSGAKGILESPRANALDQVVRTKDEVVHNGGRGFDAADGDRAIEYANKIREAAAPRPLPDKRDDELPHGHGRDLDNKGAAKGSLPGAVGLTSAGVPPMHAKLSVDQHGQDEEAMTLKELEDGNHDDTLAIKRLSTLGHCEEEAENQDRTSIRNKRRADLFVERKAYTGQTYEMFKDTDSPESSESHALSLKIWGCLDSVVEHLGPEGMSSDESASEDGETIYEVHRMPHRSHLDAIMVSIDEERGTRDRKRIRRGGIQTTRPPYREKPKNLYTAEWVENSEPDMLEELRATDPCPEWDDLSQAMEKHA